jgi:tetratricopeptide (TPR) repeat protein
MLPPSGPTVTDQHFTSREILARYPGLTDDHLRYLRKWRLIHAAGRSATGATYAFADLAVLRQVSAEISAGRSFRGIVRALLADRHGQLALDFQSETAPAKVIRLTPRPQPSTTPHTPPAPVNREAEQAFLHASELDTEELPDGERVAQLYREALAHDPDLVPALINLGNVHYSRGHMAEAQALYERSITLSPEYFEAHFNLANVLHDLGRFEDACLSYRDALAVNPRCAEAHFYLAVTLEKMGKSAEARPHWRAYQEQMPEGEWAALAREFSD